MDQGSWIVEPTRKGGGVMVVEFKAVEAIGSLVALLRVAEDAAVHCWEQEEPFDPGIFPGLILLARFAADRAGEEYKQAVVAAEVSRWNRNLQGERDHLLQRLTEVTAERDRLQQQVAELTKKLGELPPEPTPEPYQWQEGDEVEHDGVVRKIRWASGGRGRLLIEHVPAHQQWFEAIGWKLHRKASDLPQPAEPPEPYPWQVGDEVVRNGDVRSVEVVSRGYVKLRGLYSCGAQSDWERAGWKLHRKASDIGVQRLKPRHVPLDEDRPDIEPMTPQQVAEFAALTEPIDDSVGADGEGQS